MTSSSVRSRRQSYTSNYGPKPQRTSRYNSMRTTPSTLPPFSQKPYPPPTQTYTSAHYSTVPDRATTPETPRSFLRNIKNWLASPAGRSNSTGHVAEISTTPSPPTVLLAEWQAYVNYKEQERQFYQSARTKYTANPLPPLPSHWGSPTPVPPPPSETTLNPLLEHKTLGPGAVSWDIGLEHTAAMVGGQHVCIPLVMEKKQPATCPLVSHFYIVGVADDSLWPFPWPILVRNSQGVTCEDIFHAIYTKFQRFLSKQEYDQLYDLRQRDATLALASRIKRLRSDDENRSMKRIDIMCKMTYFRGLEPHPASGGYLLHLGLA
ncbi:hypothetical protein BDN72DRAFT_844121 [Pluteus cervinus]|uniref:Uncharacterized protein n=1 Tax=Pluteus cervinus TaxID=181527 RepID=A0ACD3AM73_9AGAR|nr:hypothetical protein BDN72DRAFT_844121 [Pluteus cervinus]